MMRAGACFEELAAFVPQPAHRAFRIMRHDAGEIRPRAVAKPFDGAKMRCFTGHDIVHADMKGAAGIARVAEVFFLRAFFQKNCLEAQLRASVGRRQPGDAPADNDYIGANRIGVGAIHVVL